MPRTILFMASAPNDQAKLRLDVEEREIREGLKRADFRDEFILESRGAVRIQDMLQYLMEIKPQIIHFSGHGGGQRGLVLENDDGSSAELRSVSRSLDIEATDSEQTTETEHQVLDEIASLLSGTVECIVLNACYSETQAKIMAQHIPLVVGMNSAVEDTTAIAFATSFYGALGAGETLEKAFGWAKVGIRALGLKGADIPVLLGQGSPAETNPPQPIPPPENAPVSAKPQTPDFEYDIFISYRFTQHDWADALAQNLVTQGYKVFIDAWELQGGQDFPQTIESALKNSRCALLIATPEAADSGWVQHEYELMYELKQQRQEFFFIPLVWGTFPDFPFLENLQAVDFKQSTEAQYHEGFQRLLCALQQQAPGPRPYFDGLLKLPAEEVTAPIHTHKQQSFSESVFTYLESNLPVMVLAQEGFNTQHYAHALKTRAEQQYGAENVLHVFPPASLKASTDQYFARIARQCNFSEPTHNSFDWYSQMEQRLVDGENLFLLISGFENGSQEAHTDLSGELRGLIETYPFNFKLVLLGSERLAAMKYQHGDMSLLNRLEEVPLPSMSVEDIRALYLARYGDLQVSDSTLEDILTLSGRHPRLVEAGLRALQRGQTDCEQVIRGSNLPAQLFSRFMDANEQQTLCALISQEELGFYTTWPSDKLVRRLYWQNLLRDNNKGQLVWRCELVREIGRELLAC